MIAALQGVISRRHAQFVVLEVGGVGYRVEVSARTLAALPPDGASVRLVIEPYIREDQFRLFGFLNEEEQHGFGLLLAVPGVGAKLALAIQGQFAPSSLQAMIVEGRAAELAQTPGVGKKMAARIIQELKDKFADSLPPRAAGRSARSQAEQDALLALQKLGYQPNEAQRALASSLAAPATGAPTAAAPAADASELLRRALKELAR